MISAVDAHQHFWRYNPREYAWIDENMTVLRKEYLPENLRLEANACGVIATIAVQARQTQLETDWLLGLAARDPFIVGVVGWADLRSESFAEQLEDLAAAPKLVGLRHVVQDEERGFLDGSRFNEGIALLAGISLTYDVLVREQQLPEARRFVDRHPRQVFVLDHAAKPRIAAAEFEPWSTEIRELALRGNVFCKVSGLITEADWGTWSLDVLRPYLDTLLEAFGPDRLMAASDWPVCLLAGSYERWWSTLREYFASCTVSEQSAVFHRTAEAAYGLAPTA